MFEIGESKIRSEPVPRAYMTRVLRPENETSDVKLIDPFTVANARKFSPLNVNTPPGGPEVIPSTPIKPRFVGPPPFVSMVGLPVINRLWNLRTAMGKSFGSAKNSVSRFSAVSKVEVEPKAQSEKAPSSVGPR